MKEKAGDIFIPKADNKFKEYIKTTYPNEKDNWKYGKTYYTNKSFKMKVYSKDNKHHCFYLILNKKKINDTYKEDYLKGKQLLNYTEKKLQKTINKKTNDSIKVIIPTTLDKYTDIVKERIIKEDNLLSLKFYTIEKNININNWSTEEIINQINTVITTFQNNKITPKNYNITITNSNNITESIKISNITDDFLTNPNKFEIINAIMKEEDSIYLKDNKITYKYLN